VRPQVLRDILGQRFSLAGASPSGEALRSGEICQALETH
jgi:hypothetical protein